MNNNYEIQEITVDHEAADVNTYRLLFSGINHKERYENLQYVEILKRVRGVTRSKYIVLFRRMS